eukprot:m.101628 g.101628  ORF g.101628 m.101628 type:complete len:331 (+) comp15178_c0_seq2:87-1079(+)
MANPFAAEASGAVSTKADAPGNPFGAQSNSKPSSRKGSSSVEANPFGAPPAAGSKAKTKAKAKKKGTYSSGKASTSKPGSKASSRKSSTKQPPIEETLNIPDGHMARIDSNAISVLKSTDAIQVRGSELAEDGDDDTPVAPVSDRRSTVAARSQAVAGRDDPGSAGVYASTLRRTFTLSNKSQLEVMKLVKDKQMTVEEALAFAAQKEEQEASLSLSNEAQLQLLMSVKSGQMTQEEAVEQARQQSKAEAAKQTEREHAESLAEFEDTMSQLFGTSSTLERFDSQDSLQDAMTAASQLFQDSSELDKYCAPVRPLAELEVEPAEPAVRSF